MSNNRLRLEGLDDLRRALQQLPEHLTDEASGIVTLAASQAKSEVASKYGNRRFRNKLTLTTQRTRVSVVVKLSNTDPLALVYENGSAVRHTAAGLNRGRMPPARIFGPTVARWRRTMYGDVKGLLVREGLVVTDTGPA